MTNIAFLSTAHIHSEGYLKAVKELCGKPYAVWDDVTGRGEEYAGKFNCRFVGDIDEIVADGDVDGFIVCSENTRHLPLLRKALPAGRPVMCEKPIATTFDDARAVAELVKKHNAVLTTGYFQPFSGSNRAVARIIEKGKIGRVMRAKFRNAHNAAFGRWFDSPKLAWFHDPDLAGGGALMDMGTHALHLLLHLFGKVSEVWAFTDNMSGEYTEVDDYGIIHLKFKNGVFGTVEGGWTQVGGPGGLEVSGTEATIWNMDGKLLMGKPKEEPVPVEPVDDRSTRVMRLLEAISGKLSPDDFQKDLAASLDAVAVMEAAYRSAGSGKWEVVPVIR